MREAALDHPYQSPARPAPFALSGRLLVGVHIALAVATLMPLALVDIPALVDYPNHLARMRIMADWQSTPELQQVYTVQLLLMPNTAMDLAVPWLAKFVGVIAAGKLFIAATILLFAISTVALQAALQGRIGLSSLAVHPVTFNLVLSYGFLNYLFGIGAAILALAFWIRLQHRGWRLRLSVGAVGAVVILICHPIAFGCYGLCVFAYELSPWLRSQPRSWQQLPWRCGVAALQFLPALVLLLAVSPSASGSELDIYYLAREKLASFYVPTLFYFEPVDLALALALVGTVAYYRMKGEIRLDPALIPCAAGLAIAVLVTPTWMAGNWGNGFRLAVPLAMVVIAMCRLEPRGRRAFLVVAAAVLSTYTVRQVTIADHWVKYDALFKELGAAAAELEPGARVLPAVANTDRIRDVAPVAYEELFDHVPSLLLLDSAAFVPTLFTAEGRQPLSVRPEFSHIDVPHGAPLPVSVLTLAVDPRSGAEIEQLLAEGTHFYHRFAGWPANFDYVLMIDFGQQQNPIPSILTRAMSGSYYTLYRINDAKSSEQRSSDRAAN